MGFISSGDETVNQNMTTKERAKSEFYSHKIKNETFVLTTGTDPKMLDVTFPV